MVGQGKFVKPLSGHFAVAALVDLLTENGSVRPDIVQVTAYRFKVISGFAARQSAVVEVLNDFRRGFFKLKKCPGVFVVSTYRYFGIKALNILYQNTVGADCMANVYLGVTLSVTSMQSAPILSDWWSTIETGLEHEMKTALHCKKRMSFRKC